jgi:hypothetical protein
LKYNNGIIINFSPQNRACPELSCRDGKPATTNQIIEFFHLHGAGRGIIKYCFSLCFAVLVEFFSLPLVGKLYTVLWVDVDFNGFFALALDVKKKTMEDSEKMCKLRVFWAFGM